MLGVGGGGLDGDGTAPEEVDVVHLGLVAFGQVGGLDDVDALLELLPDAPAQEEDGQVAAIDDFLDQVICCWVWLGLSFWAASVDGDGMFISYRDDRVVP
jgi:hypothetical protein